MKLTFGKNVIDQYLLVGKNAETVDDWTAMYLHQSG